MYLSSSENERWQINFWQGKDCLFWILTFYPKHWIKISLFKIHFLPSCLNKVSWTRSNFFFLMKQTIVMIISCGFALYLFSEILKSCSAWNYLLLHQCWYFLTFHFGFLLEFFCVSVYSLVLPFTILPAFSHPFLHSN